jgi:hypothetical protein
MIASTLVIILLIPHDHENNDRPIDAQDELFSEVHKFQSGFSGCLI